MWIVDDNIKTYERNKKVEVCIQYNNSFDLIFFIIQYKINWWNGVLKIEVLKKIYQEKKIFTSFLE